MQETMCQHCGDTIRTKRPDLRKWCDRCRSLKALLQLRDKAHKCIACDRRYYALDSYSARTRMRMCPDCSGRPAGEHRDTEPCAFCDSHHRLMPGVALCYVCAADANDIDKAQKVSVAAVRKLKAVARA